MKRLLFFLLLLPAFGFAQNPQLWYIKNSFFDTVRFYSPVYHLSYGVGSTSDSVMVVTSTGKVLRVAQNSIVGATPTIQQVLDAGSALSSSETITLAGNILSVNGTTTTAQFNASTGALTLSNSGNAGISVSTTYTGTGNFFSRSASSDSPPVASFKNTTDGTNTEGRILSLGRATTGTPGDGIGGELNFSLETAGTGGAEDILAGKLIVKFSTVDHPTRTSQWDFAGIDNTTEETFMNIQKDLIRFNNNADTVASKAYARSVGGGGGATDLSDITAPLNVANALIFNGSQSGGVSAPAPYGEAKFNFYDLSGLSTNATFAAPAGTPAEFNMLYMRIQDNGTSRTLSWNAIYDEGSDLALPTATIAGQGLRLQFSYNGNTSKWELIGQTGGF